MPKETLTVRVETETRASLDAIAEAMNRDRSFVVNEALSAYVEVFQWQVDHIKKGIRQANAGKFVPEVELKRRVDRLKMDLSPVLRQPVKTQNPSNGELSHGIVS